MIHKHIEIVRPTLVGLSSMGLKSCDMIIDVLRRYYDDVGMTIVNTIEDLDILAAKEPDLVFLGMKSLPSTVGTVWLPAYLEESGLNYIGSNSSAITLDNDKPLAKTVVKNAGLKTAGHFMAKPGQYSSNLPLSYPLFVKPPSEGGGKGIGADSVVRDFAAFERKVQSIADELHSPALVEQYLPGREFSVAMLGEAFSTELTIMPIELITEKNQFGDRVLGRKIKAADTEHAIAIKDPSLKREIETFALAVFKALGARDYGRIDIRLDSHGAPHFLEANLIPGLANHDFISYFTSACMINESIDYEAMILRIVELGLSHAETLELDTTPHPSYFVTV